MSERSKQTQTLQQQDHTRRISDEPLPEDAAQQPAREESPEAEETAAWEDTTAFPGPKEAPESGHPAQGLVHHRRHRRKRRLLRLLIAVCVCAVLVIIGHLPVFQIQQIPVIGNKAVSDQEILDLSGIEQGDSIIFLNTLRVGSRIKKNLYIDSVHIKRELPGSLEIIVTERQAAAQLLRTDKKKKKTYVIIDENGMVMDLAEKKQQVTTIDDLTVASASEGSQIRVEENGSYQKAMDLIAAARAGDLYFKRIQIKGSLVTAWIYGDLKCKGRFSNVIDSIQAGELRSVVYRLYQEDVSKGTINIGDNNYCSFTPKK